MWLVVNVALQQKRINPSPSALCYLTDLITGHFLHSNHLAAYMRLEEFCVPAERSIMDHKCPSGPRPSLFSPLSVPVFLFFFFNVMCTPRGSSWIINVERFNATYRRNTADVHRDAASEPFTAGWPELQVKFKHNCTIKLTGDAAAASCTTKRTANLWSRNGCCRMATSGKNKKNHPTFIKKSWVWR